MSGTNLVQHGCLTVWQPTGSYRAIGALKMLSASERKAHRNPSAAARTCGCVRMEW
jgi:hypothetical protein